MYMEGNAKLDSPRRATKELASVACNVLAKRKMANDLRLHRLQIDEQM